MSVPAKNKKQLRSRLFWEWMSILSIFILSFVLVAGHQSRLYQASVMSNSKVNEDFYTVLPIQKISSDFSDRYTDVSELSPGDFKDIPLYDPEALETPISQINWGSDDAYELLEMIRVYTVCYMDDYEVGEGTCVGSGSHPGIDIVTNPGTEVHAIADGEVIGVTYSNYGFGNSISVLHESAPSPWDPDEPINLISNYSHLQNIYVSEGDHVNVNEVIGAVGSTGNASVSHLDFEINYQTGLDGTPLPFYPWWPFSSADASAAGLDFYSGVNEGLGQSKIPNFATDPMLYVQKYMNGIDGTKTVQDDGEFYTPSDLLSKNFDHLQIHMEDSGDLGDETSIKIYALDENDELVDDLTFDGEITLSASPSNSISLNYDSLTENDFYNGKVKIDAHLIEIGTVTVSATYDNLTYTSDNFLIEGDLSNKPVDHFELVYDGSFQPNVNETITIRALDEDGAPTVFDNNTPISVRVYSGSADLDQETISKNDFMASSEAEFTFSAPYLEDPLVLHFQFGSITELAEFSVVSLNDVSEDDENYAAIEYLYREGIISGNPDGSFQGDEVLNRAAALKIIINTSGLELVSATDVPELSEFSDLEEGAWYMDYIATGVRYGIIQGYPDGTIKPGQSVNRVELLTMLFRTLDEKGLSLPDPMVLTEPYDDVNRFAWFAPYVNYSKEKNLFPLDGKTENFEPGTTVTREETAVLVYRFLVMTQNNAEKYLETLSPKE